MIAHVRGQLVFAGADSIVVDVNGVGYRCMVPTSTRSRLPAVGQEIMIYTSLQVREDSMTLFGFLTQNEYGVFNQLIKVEGIGPKVALSVLSNSTPEALQRAIVLDDVNALTRIPGIGKKTAQRMVLELKDKMGAAVPGLAGAAGTGLTAADAGLASVPGDAGGEAMEALMALGYTRADAALALEKARKEAGEEPATTTLVRLSLKHLFRG